MVSINYLVFFFRFYWFFIFFFFQAEDGIRDDLVTGVQTCALPISLARAADVMHQRGDGAALVAPAQRGDELQVLLHGGQHALCRDLAGVQGDQPHVQRSEERRVGKESRTRWARDQEKANKVRSYDG